MNYQKKCSVKLLYWPCPEEVVAATEASQRTRQDDLRKEKKSISDINVDVFKKKMKQKVYEVSVTLNSLESPVSIQSMSLLPDIRQKKYQSICGCSNLATSVLLFI